MLVPKLPVLPATNSLSTVKVSPLREFAEPEFQLLVKLPV